MAVPSALGKIPEQKLFDFQRWMQFFGRDDAQNAYIPGNVKRILRNEVKISIFFRKNAQSFDQIARFPSFRP